MIVHIRNHDWDSHWDMRFDLKFICENMGKKINDGGEKYVALTIPHTRRIFRIIKRYAEDLAEIQNFLKGYPKALEVWSKIK